MRSAAPAALSPLLSAAVVLGACTRAELEPIPEPESAAADNKLEVRGEFCTTDPDDVRFPVKIAFVIDTSSSMETTDPTLERVNAIVEVINSLTVQNPDGTFALVDGVEIGVISFGLGANIDTRDATGGTGYTTDPVEATAAALTVGRAAGTTDYIGALEVLVDLVASDMSSSSADDLQNARYVNIFLSDGIPDKDDLCPDQPGTLSTSGCPDTDGDGMIDRDDACPNEAGPAANNGCPVADADGDGVTDDMDECPDTFGKAELNGCPDTDSDGIADKDDLCPQAAGTPEMGGCPDSDGDGIPDNEDACPDQPGLLSLRGCPMQDRDRDGIADSKDACPDEAGSRATSGCPDADGDGVADKDDLCPDQAGTLKGCPDSDGDGVADHMDNCPSTAGSALNYGCPDIIEKKDRERLEFAAHAVQFETGKATLKAESYAILDEVVAILQKYPEYEVVIRGHTDNTGTPQANQILSEERARSCYEYLIARGIEPERLSYEGVGEREPIADNSTEEGRQLNRRVEFKLIPRKQ